MFCENTGHVQQELFNSLEGMNAKIKKKLSESWAPYFYELVFKEIDESKFSKLYCNHNGRPNFPINILLSLEFIKHMKDYSDEELLEQFCYNYQVMYALGLRDLGNIYLSKRTLYEFRNRIYQYIIRHPEEEDLIFQQFELLTKNFIQEANINTR